MASFADHMDSQPDPPQYVNLLQEAFSQSEQLANLVQAGCVTIGSDPEGHPTILLIPHLGLPKVYLPGETEVDMLKKVMLLFIKEANDVVKSPYTLVYGHTSLTWMGHRELISNTYQMLPRRYKKNIRSLYVIHPSFTVKLFFEFAKLFVSSKFFKKVRNIDRILSLQKIIGHEHLPLPPPFLAAEEEGVKAKGEPMRLVDLFEERYSAPKLVYDCVTFIRTKGLDLEGVFRVPGDGVVGALAMNRFKDIMDISTIIIGQQSEQTTLATSSTLALLHVDKVYDAASIMGKFLNSIPVPVFTFDAYCSIVEAGTSIEGNLLSSEVFKGLVLSAVSRLPHAHQKTLEFIICFLCELTSHSIVNKMTPENLAIVFGPTLLHAEAQVQDLGLALRHIKISQMVIRVLIAEFQMKLQSEQTSSASSDLETEVKLSLQISADILSRGSGRRGGGAAADASHVGNQLSAEDISNTENEISSRISSEILSRGSGRSSKIGR